MSCVQSELLNINVGGEVFSTTATTLLRYPTSKLASLCQQRTSKQSPLLIDRSSWPFKYVIDFVRVGAQCLLPSSAQELDRILIEAEYFQLPELVKHLETALDLWSQKLALEGKSKDERYFLVQGYLVKLTRSVKARSQLLLDKFIGDNNRRRLGFCAERPMVIDRDYEMFQKCFSESNPRDLLPWQIRKASIHSSLETSWCPTTCRLRLHPYIDQMEEEARYFQMTELLADIDKCRLLHAECMK